MDRTELDTRDRRNLYATDATNVIVVAANADEIEDNDHVVDDELHDALLSAKDGLVQNGHRFAYVVVRIER